MINKIVLGTNNPHKLEEMNEIGKDYGIEFILPPKEFKADEVGKSFEENSYIKAKAAQELTKMVTLADDSGLCVEALNGAPGLYSSRYAGTQQEKIAKLLKELENETNRKAKFVCCMTLLNEEGELLTQVLGECKGEIIKEAKGINGFGYDPIFLVEGTEVTMAEMSEDEKNKISHRAVALGKIIDYIKTNLSVI